MKHFKGHEIDWNRVIAEMGALVEKHRGAIISDGRLNPYATECSCCGEKLEEDWMGWMVCPVCDAPEEDEDLRYEWEVNGR